MPKCQSPEILPGITPHLSHPHTGACKKLTVSRHNHHHFFHDAFKNVTLFLHDRRRARYIHNSPPSSVLHRRRCDIITSQIRAIISQNISPLGAQLLGIKKSFISRLFSLLRSLTGFTFLFYFFSIVDSSWFNFHRQQTFPGNINHSSENSLFVDFVPSSQ